MSKRNLLIAIVALLTGACSSNTDTSPPMATTGETAGTPAAPSGGSRATGSAGTTTPAATSGMNAGRSGGSTPSGSAGKPSTSAGGGSAGNAPAAGSGGHEAGSAGDAAAGGASGAGGSAGKAAEAGSGGASAGSGGAHAGAGGAHAGAGGASGMSAAGASAGASGAAGGGGSDAVCPVVVADADCDQNQRPFVFVHGTYGSGDNITHVAELFGSNGFCQDRFVSVEYNSVALGSDTSGLIDAVVDEVRMRTGQDKVDIACHSQGTYQCTNYMQQPARAAKIAHYINLSGAVTVPNNVDTLSLSSDNDLGGGPDHALNATNRVTFKDLDHMGVAASTEAFVEMWKYLHDGKEPMYKTVQCGEDPITIESMVETFADNTPIANAKVQAFEITDTPREQGTPAATAMSDAKGRVPAFQLKRNVQYELQASDASGKIIARNYFTPFKRSNRLVRFLAPSGDPGVLAQRTGMVATSADFSAISARYLGGSFRHDLNETLTVGDKDVLTDMTAGRSIVTVGLFMSDQNKNKKSDYGVSFTSNFLVGTDVYFDASKAMFIEFTWKDPFGQETKLKVPNWPSSDRILTVMLP
jgi:hypothetical protein